MDTPLNQAVMGPTDPNDNSSSAWFYYFGAGDRLYHKRLLRDRLVPACSSLYPVISRAKMRLECYNYVITI
jgi:hypothetical protein